MMKYFDSFSCLPVCFVYFLNGGDGDSLNDLIDSVEEYSAVLSQFNFVQKLKENLVKSEKSDEG